MFIIYLGDFPYSKHSSFTSAIVEANNLNYTYINSDVFIKSGNKIVYKCN